MSNNEEKKSTAPLQRLASLKTPRDLSLGGVKPNKKVFTPNLNAARNKNKGPSTTNVREQKNDDKAKKYRKNKWIKNHGSNIIKSSGVFSDGLVAVERHSSRVSYGREVEPAPALHKPTIRVKNVIKIDKELEDKRIESVLGDGAFDDDIGEDFRKAPDIYAPIKLPMDDGAVKLEQKPLVEVKKEFFEDSDAVNLLRSDQPTLILIQLPDSLPGRGGSVNDDVPSCKPAGDAHSSSTADNNTPETPAEDRCLLADMEEGRIGKLQIRRSGRVTLVVGQTVCEVETGTKPAFHQEIVSVAADDATRSANLVSLGPLCHKLTVVPDWDNLFSHMSV